MNAAADLAATEPLFSPRWYRVARLKPRLRPHVRLRRQSQRGVDWFLLIDEAAEDVRRVNHIAHEFIGRLDGSHTVQQIWDDLLGARPEEALPQDEVVRLLIALHSRGLVEFDASPDVESMFRARARSRRGRRLRDANPLAFRLSLFDPSRLLARLEPLGRRLFGPAAGIAWLLAVLLAGVVAAQHQDELVAHGRRLLGTPRALFIGWLVYPFIKALHECAHGLAVQRWGGQVRQAGLSLLMLTPVPFVNASAADAFRHRYQRALTSAAGIMAELAVAALALAVWLAVQPGGVRDLAWLAMSIGAASTLLVNGNPLMRLDGYYLLCDVFDLRNLGLRSAAWWRQALFGAAADSAEAVHPLPGERPWLIAYAPLALVYRLGLSLGLGLWIGSQSALLGAAVGGGILWATLLRPLLAAGRGLSARGAWRRAWRPALAGAAVLALLAWLPVPFSTLAQGIVWLPERAEIRAGTDGFIASYAARDGDRVHAGQLIATLRDERLAATAAALAADAIDLEVAMFTALAADPDKVPALREKLAYSRAEAARNAARIDLLQVRAQGDGVLVVPHQQDQVGSYRKKGEMIGHLVTDDPLRVRVALPQEEAGLLRGRPGAGEPAGADVGVRLAEEGWRLRRGTLQRDLDAAVTRLPSAALGQPAGGDLAVDPADKDGLTTLAPVVLMDVEVAGLQAATLGDRVGERALVRIDHGSLSLGRQALRRLQQLVLRHFNPAG